MSALDIDEVAVMRAVSGDLCGAKLTVDERVEAVRQLNARGYSDSEVAARVDCAAETVARIRRRHGIPVAQRDAA